MGIWVPAEVRHSLRGARGWWAALLWDHSPVGTLSSPCQGKAKAEAPPSPWPPWPPRRWVSAVPVQCCSPARQRAYGSPREFWEVFSSPPAVQRWGITCLCGGRQAQRGRLNLSPTASQLPQNAVRGCPPFPEGTAAVPGSPGPPGATQEAAPGLSPLPAPKQRDARQHSW